jgi:hypothetical protein
MTTALAVGIVIGYLLRNIRDALRRPRASKLDLSYVRRKDKN